MTASVRPVTLTAGHDVQNVWTLGNLAASISAGNQVDGVTCYGAIASTDVISAPHGSVDSVVAWGALAGQIMRPMPSKWSEAAAASRPRSPPPRVARRSPTTIRSRARCPWFPATPSRPAGPG